MVKPADIQDYFGDYYAGCPNCKGHISFSFIWSPYNYDQLPKQCKRCGEEFDWEDFKKETK